MGYKSKVFEYAQTLDEYQQSQLVSIIKRSIQDGFTYKWIWTALNHKDKDVWAKFGYGLFLNKGFRKEISNKLTTTKEEANKQASVFSIDSLPDDNETEETKEETNTVPSSSTVPSVSSLSSGGRSVVDYTPPVQSSSINQKQIKDEPLPDPREQIKEFKEWIKQESDCGKKLTTELENRSMSKLFDICFPNTGFDIAYLDKAKTIEDDEFAARMEKRLYKIKEWNNLRSNNPEEAKRLVDKQKLLRLITGCDYAERCKRQRLWDKNKMIPLEGAIWSKWNIYSLLDGYRNS